MGMNAVKKKKIQTFDYREGDDQEEGCTNDSAGHEALVLIVTCQKGGMWATIAHRHAEALG